MAPVPAEPVEVKVYSGHSYAQRPESFRWRDVSYQVGSIAGEWKEPGRRHFLVRARGDGLFEICYDERKKQWLLLGRGAQGRIN
jgi:hypothetical protein